MHVLLSLRDDFLFRCATREPRPRLPRSHPAGPALAGRACGGPWWSRRPARRALRGRGAGRRDGGRRWRRSGERCRSWPSRSRGSGRSGTGRRRLLTREAYERIGGVAGALAQHAEATLARARTGARAGGARDLPEPGDGGGDAGGARAGGAAVGLRAETARGGRGRARRAGGRAAADGVRRPSASRQGRIRERRPRPRIEIVHESLLTHWPRLERWQTQDEDGALLRDQLRQAARLWDESGPDGGRSCGPGASYREYAPGGAGIPGGLSALEEDFAQAMTGLAGRRRRRRRIAFATLVAASGRSRRARDVLESERDLAAEGRSREPPRRGEQAPGPGPARAGTLPDGGPRLRVEEPRAGRHRGGPAFRPARLASRAHRRSSNRPRTRMAAVAFSPNGQWLSLVRSRYASAPRLGRPPADRCRGRLCHARLGNVGRRFRARRQHADRRWDRRPAHLVGSGRARDPATDAPNRRRPMEVLRER